MGFLGGGYAEMYRLVDEWLASGGVDSGAIDSDRQGE